MSSKSSIEAGKGHVTLTMDQTLLERGLQMAQAKMQAFGKGIAMVGASIAAAGAAITAPFLAGLAVFSEWGHEIKNASRETGIGWQQLGSLAGGLRVDMESLVPAVAKMSAFLDEAAHGSHDANRQLLEMGMTLQELQGLTQDERLLRFADGISQIGDAAQRIAMQRAVFGRGGLDLNLEGGRTGVQRRVERHREVFGERTPEDFTSAKAYHEAQKEMALATKGLWAALGAAAAPAMTEFFQLVTKVIIEVRKWITENQDLLSIVFRVADAMVTAGAVIGILGGLVYGAAYSFAFISGAIAITSGVLATLWGWATFAATGFGILTAATWAFQLVHSVGAGVVSAAMGVYAAATGLASGSTGGFTLALAIAWVWENIVSAGTYLLVTALGALVIAIGAVVIALGGFVIFTGIMLGAAAAVAYFAGSFGELHQSLAFLDDVVSWVKEIWVWVEECTGAVSMLANAWTWLSDLFASEFMQTVIGGIAVFVAVIVGAAIGIYKLGQYLYELATAGDEAEGVFSKLAKAVRFTYENIKDIASRAAAWFVEKWTNAFSPIISGFSSTLGFLQGIGANVMAQFSTLTSTITSAVGSAVSQTVSGFTSMFSGLVGTATTAWSGIRDAFAVGDWTLMWDIVKAAARLAWAQVVAFIEPTWNVWKDAAIDVWFTIGDALVDTFESAWAKIRAVFVTGWAEFKALAWEAAAAAANALGDEAGGRQMQATADSVRAVGRVQAVGIENRAAADQVDRENERAIRDGMEWFLRQQRDAAAADGNQAEVQRFQDDLENLQVIAAGMAWYQEQMRGGGPDVSPPGGDLRVAGNSFSMGSFSNAVIEGFLGASGSAGETRAELQARRAADELVEIRRMMQRQRGVVMQ